ncbi:ribosomal protein S4 (apicoplast) [Theileria orientalis]|uniref:Ribosomal protein S4 n=1 Tax=Theileria orientalis TaxID=68886 RepID=A0A976SJW4_THEOR|nr:ribosomal protein S4 [Theileria orientalis]
MSYNIKKLKILKKFNLRNLYGFTNKFNFMLKFKHINNKKEYYKLPTNIKILKILYDIKIKKLKYYFKKFLVFNLYNFLKTIQLRLDFILLNFNLCTTINQAKQYISHKHILINNKIARRSSYCVKNNDIIHFNNTFYKNIKKIFIYNYLINNLKFDNIKKNTYKSKLLNNKTIKKLFLKLDTNNYNNILCSKQLKLKINNTNPINIVYNKYLNK